MEKSEIIMEQIYAFGKPVPQSVLDEISEEYGPEFCNTEFIETLYEYEHRDSES